MEDVRKKGVENDEKSGKRLRRKKNDKRIKILLRRNKEDNPFTPSVGICEAATFSLLTHDYIDRERAKS